MGGTGSIHNVTTDYSTDPPDVAITDGNGPAIVLPGGNDNQANLNIDFFHCTYNFTASILIDMIHTDSTGPTPIQGDVGGARSDDYPLIITTPVTTLSGSLDFPAHSPMWGVTNPGEAFFPGMEGNTMFFIGAATDDNAGIARVTWSFTAQLPPP